MCCKQDAPNMYRTFYVHIGQKETGVVIMFSCITDDRNTGRGTDVKHCSYSKQHNIYIHDVIIFKNHNQLISSLLKLKNLYIRLCRNKIVDYNINCYSNEVNIDKNQNLCRTLYAGRQNHQVRRKKRKHDVNNYTNGL